MFHSDVHFDTPTGGDLLAEIGIGRDTVIEIIEEDRAMRCPDRGAARREDGIADIDSASRAFPPAR